VKLAPFPDIIPGIMTMDGLEAYSWGITSGGYGMSDIYVITRETLQSTWSEPVNLGGVVNCQYIEIMPSISPDGLELYFSDYTYELAHPDGLGGGDLWFTKRATRKDPWQEPENLGPTVNSVKQDARLHISADGLLLLFDSKREGGYGGQDLYMTRRESLSDSWGEAMSLGPYVNTPEHEYNPSISPDGHMLYFVRNHDIWQAPVISTESSVESNNHANITRESMEDDSTKKVTPEEND
jgi:Tol biopolymer transport system component